MSKTSVIRAWKDPNYRKSLSAAERASLPANPAGLIQLTDEDLGRMAGGADTPLTIGTKCYTIKFTCNCQTAPGHPC